jgi:hypothetical protein
MLQNRLCPARDAPMSGLGARELPCREIGLAKIRRKQETQSQQARHPVDIGPPFNGEL